MNVCVSIFDKDSHTTFYL